MEKAVTDVGTLVVSLFRSFHNDKILYCVLRNYENLPNEVGNDLDVLVERRSVLNAEYLLLDCASKIGWELVRSCKRLGANTYIFFKSSDDNHAYFHIDIVWAFVLKRVDWASDTFVLSRRRYHRGFYVASDGCQAALVVRNALVGVPIKQRYLAQIKKKISRNMEEFRSTYDSYFSKKDIDFFIKSMLEESYRELHAKAPSILRRARFFQAFRNPIRFIGYHCSYIFELFRETFLNPNGLFVVLIGPDGVGKTTISERLIDELVGPIFSSGTYGHTRPGFLPSISRLFFRDGSKSALVIPLEPGASHERTPAPMHSSSRCLAYYTYYWVDYFSLWFTLPIVRGRGGMILYDRYIYEYKIQKAYGSLPELYYAFLARFVVRPDLLIYLSAPAHIILSRKRELTENELVDQQSICKRLVSDHSNGVEISSNQGVTNTFKDIEKEIMTFLSRRESQRREDRVSSS